MDKELELSGVQWYRMGSTAIQLLKPNTNPVDIRFDAVDDKWEVHCEGLEDHQPYGYFDSLYEAMGAAFKIIETLEQAYIEQSRRLSEATRLVDDLFDKMLIKGNPPSEAI